MRKKPPPEDHGDYTYVEHVHVPLDHGASCSWRGQHKKTGRRRFSSKDAVRPGPSVTSRSCDRDVTEGPGRIANLRPDGRVQR
ncbi:unnamed protein product [Ranitomeya imitator]|uniref:Uncharacterized protein n=1 Tax=Ranitomeya imitator TaxID=111125 RepID=A0ABN9L113_9NEOB|nr:unnamed protein product [Ranitomeya imitator]